jgi:hypothetical protein
MWSFWNGAAARGIVVEHCIKRCDRSVMHVRTSHYHIAQGRGAETAHIFGLARHFAQASVVRRIGAHAIEVVQRSIVKRDLRLRQPPVGNAVAEVEPTVTMRTLQLFAEEQRFTAFSGG